MPEEKDANVSKKNGGAEACYNIVKVEYSHVFNRSDKLDNKVYIALTFCAFIFIFVMDLLNAIMNFKYPTDINQLVLIVMYVILCFLTIGIFIYILIKLAALLKPMKIVHIKADFIMNNNFQEHTSDDVYTFGATKYADAINDNNIELEKRFNKYNNIITKIIILVICAFLLNIIKIFIKTN
jgi:hypothetical protein